MTRYFVSLTNADIQTTKIANVTTGQPDSPLAGWVIETDNKDVLIDRLSAACASVPARSGWRESVPAEIDRITHAASCSCCGCIALRARRVELDREAAARIGR